MKRMSRRWAAALLCLAVLPLAGCSPLTEGAVGLARTADGRIIAMVFSCDDEDATVVASARIPSTATRGDYDQQDLYDLSAEIRGGTTVVPLSVPATEPWTATSGAPIAAAERRALKVRAWGDRDKVNLGTVWFTRAELPVVTDAGSPDRLAVRARHARSPSATPTVSSTAGWPTDLRPQTVTVDRFVRDAGDNCE